MSDMFLLTTYLLSNCRSSPRALSLLEVLGSADVSLVSLRQAQTVLELCYWGQAIETESGLLVVQVGATLQTGDGWVRVD